MDTLHDLAQTTGGRILPASRIADSRDVALGRIVTDSRQVQPGDVFWALQGANFEGDCFVHDALRHGAQGAVASRIEGDNPIFADPPPARARPQCAAKTGTGYTLGATRSACENGWILQVDDTQQALVQWALWKRRSFTGIVIGVTGSVGKTTTRQMIHTVLQSRLQGTASPRNYNNHWGVPLSMLAIQPQLDYAVLELGASQLGEIAALADLAAPKVGVITQLGDAHLGGFGSRQGVAEAKAELLAALPSCGHAVLTDDTGLRALASRCAAPITWIGSGPQCDLRATNIETGNDRLEFHVLCGSRAQLGTGRQGNKPVRFLVPVWGRHHIPSALSAIAVGRMIGFDLEEIAAALARYEVVPMRCEVSEIRGTTIINDTYNSNPTAMRAALELLRDFDVAGRRIVVCGDMAELGPQSIALHWQIGKEIVQIGGAELVIACGQFARHVTAGARSTGLERARAVPCDTIDEAMRYSAQVVLPGDVVLVKGSRVMAMERVIDALRQSPQRKSA